MKLKLSLPSPVYQSIRSLFKAKGQPEGSPEPSGGRGETLARLHEYQHEVILGLFKINIAGLAAFFLIVLSFTLFTMADPYAPRWIGIMMISVGSLLLVGCYRTVRELKSYRKQYDELVGQIQAKLRQYIGRQQNADQRPARKTPESRVLSVLKPQEHKGCDFKTCGNCDKQIELLALVCQHCEQEQESLLRN